MDCKSIRQLMHEVLDKPEKMLKESENIISHCQGCPDCSSLWAELQLIEKGLFDMDCEELPLDFSTIDWEMLSQADNGISKEFAGDKGASSKLPRWVIVLLTGLVILSLGVWGSITIPGVWGFISQALAVDLGGIFNAAPLVNQVIGLIKDIAYWILLLSTLWDVSLSFVLTNFVQVVITVLACSALVIHLLKTRERISFN
ncbi:hypothetical protein [Desulfitibacter alkalitolerans]|uniref:hypothetical protein n=1 Tax=Desulfitibacter alkalitolerans TaxID=264641 RepID=UPI000485C784|nr:hypothetical protein [Desulfitibacter alkalitolerans]